MSRKIKVKINWRKTKPLQMASLAHGVANAVESNKKFTNSPVKNTELETSATLVETTFSTRKDGKVKKDEFNNAVTDLDKKLHSVAEFVNGIANGDETVIHEASFESTKSKNSLASKPIVPNALKLESMPNGTIKSIANSVDGAKSYTHVLQLDSDDFTVTIVNDQIEIPVGAHVFIIPNTTRSASFLNLAPMKKVLVAVIANNAAGSSGFSPVSNTSTIL